MIDDQVTSPRTILDDHRVLVAVQRGGAGLGDAVRSVLSCRALFASTSLRMNFTTPAACTECHPLGVTG
jgi:hypothetical protein